MPLSTLGVKDSYVTFQGFVNGLPEGGLRFTYPLYKALERIRSNEYSFFSGTGMSCDGILRSSSLGRRHKWETLVIKLLSHKSERIRRRKRDWLEIAFDRAVSMHIKTPTVLFTSAVAPFTVRKNAILGGMNIYLALNPAERELFEVTRAVSKKYGICVADTYADVRRTDRVMDAINLCDAVACFTHLQERSFRRYLSGPDIWFTPSALLPYSEFDAWTPNKDAESKTNEGIVNITYVAHTSLIKGIITLLEAWEMGGFENCCLNVVGSIGRELKAYIGKRFAALSQVRFTGHSDSIGQILKNSDICVIASYVDAANTVLCEAMWHGVPVIATFGTGNAMIIEHGRDGIVVNPQNPGELWHAMKTLAANSPVRTQMGQLGALKIRDVLIKSSPFNVGRWLHNKAVDLAHERRRRRT